MRWDEFSEVLDWSDIDGLGATLAAHDEAGLEAMQLRLRQVRPLFTVDGLIAYGIPSHTPAFSVASGRVTCSKTAHAQCSFLLHARPPFLFPTQVHGAPDAQLGAFRLESRRATGL